MRSLIVLLLSVLVTASAQAQYFTPPPAPTVTVPPYYLAYMAKGTCYSLSYTAYNAYATANGWEASALSARKRCVDKGATAAELDAGDSLMTAAMIDEADGTLGYNSALLVMHGADLHLWASRWSDAKIQYDLASVVFEHAEDYYGEAVVGYVEAHNSYYAVYTKLMATAPTYYYSP